MAVPHVVKKAARKAIWIDIGKKVKGRKRQIVVDVSGNFLHVKVHAANVFAWLGNFRRLAKDIEILTAISENMIRIAMIILS